jgi:putative transposase
MTANLHSIDLSRFVAEHLERAKPDLLRSLFSSFLQAYMSAEADELCGAPYGVHSAKRTNSRNGYRSGDFDTAPALSRSPSRRPEPLHVPGR